MPRARLHITVDFELGESVSYPDEVLTWEDAARFDWEQCSMAIEFDHTSALVGVDIEGDHGIELDEDRQASREFEEGN